MNAHNKIKNAIVSRNAVFQWDEVELQLHVTTKARVVHLTADKVRELMALLVDNRDIIIAADEAMTPDERDLTIVPDPKKQGFAALTPEQRKANAQKGGRRAHELGAAHVFSKDEAQAAGKVGGTVSRRRKKTTTE